MIYVVSGFGRCGTSLMMAMLEHSGVTPFVDPVREVALSKYNRGDYKANPGGFYEIPQADWLTHGFAKEIPDEYCVKIGLRGIGILASHIPYRIVILHRDPALIRESYKRAFQDEDFDKNHPCWPELYDALIDTVPGIIEQRADMEGVVINFPELFTDPIGQFEKMRDIGFPIKDSAAELIDHRLHRVAA